jgi:hypothetical protein
MSGETFTREICRECRNREIGLGELPCGHCSAGYVYTQVATPPASEIVPEGTAPRNPNLLLYEYEMDLRLAAKALEDSMPNTAERVRWLAGIMAKTRPQKDTPNAQG